MSRLASRSWARVAIAGTTYATRETTAANRVDQFARVSSRSVFVDQGGQSDLLASITAANLLIAVEAYAEARRTAGFDVLLGTTVPHSTQYSVGQNNERLAYNDLLLASTVFDAIADLASDSRLADATNLTYWNADGLHPTTAGASAIADVVESTLAELSIV